MKKFLPDLIAILAFISYLFRSISSLLVTEDRILFQHDTVAGAGAGTRSQRIL